MSIAEAKNPFGDVMDGTADAAFTDGFGLAIAQGLGIPLGPPPAPGSPILAELLGEP